MKILLGCLLFFFGFQALAAFDIKPGLWNVKMTMSVDGKVFDPLAEVTKVLESLPPEQRKQMESVLGAKGHMPAGKDGIAVCYSAESLKNPVSMVDNSGGCKTKTTSQTAKTISGTFECTEDGSKGTFEWSAKSDSEYVGLMNGKNRKGENTVIRYEGKFRSSDCGKIKPTR